MLSRLPAFTLLFIGLVIAGCAREEGAGAGEEAAGMEEGAGVEEMALPDTTGAAVWEYLQGVDYRVNWQLWPGKGELYEGQEPHGQLLTTYLNSAAHAALAGLAGSMPAGAIIVKENYMPDSTLAAITVMYKVAGYDSEHNDWFWTKLMPDGTVEVEGRGQGCIACHAAQSRNDYIFTGSLSESEGE